MPNNENVTHGTSYSATNNGNGAIAQGNGAQAIGTGAVHVCGNNSGNINTGTQTNGISPEALAALFAPLLAVIAEAPADKQAAALQQVEALKAEIAKGKDAKDKTLANTIKGLLEYVPATIGALTALVSSPLVGDMVGAATEFVLGI
ncbi:MAG: hypothetical protein PHU06_05000 [Gallionella sp.]|nr:hypothetical protein [Gallionella sp.]MDD4957975.1 hypothetical protein [Gallionella sp.]